VITGPAPRAAVIFCGIGMEIHIFFLDLPTETDINHLTSRLKHRNIIAFTPESKLTAALLRIPADSSYGQTLYVGCKKTK